MSSTSTKAEDLLQHAQFVRRLATGLLRDDNDAEDIAQETMSRALQDGPAERSRQRAWLGRVLRNLVRRRTRDRLRRKRREERAARCEAVPAAAELAERNELLRLIARRVRALPEPYRSTVRLRYYDGLGPGEIARTRGLAEATVKTRLRRALVLLRGSLDDAHRGSTKRWQHLLLPLVIPRPKDPVSPMISTSQGIKLALLALPVAGAVWVLAPASGPGFRDSDRVDQPSGAPTSAGAALRHVAVRVQKRGYRVSGHVREPDGDPVPDAGLLLFLGPHPGGDPGRSSAPKKLRTDARGSYAFDAGRATEVMVLLVDQRWKARGDPVRATAPATGVDLVVEPVPSAKLVIRARDLDRGEQPLRFACRFHVLGRGSAWPGAGSFHGGTFSAATARGVLVQHVRICPGSAPTRVEIFLSGPGHGRKRLELRADQVMNIEIPYRSGRFLTGHVRAANGAPITGALVFAGRLLRGRGDEPFQPFDPTRIHDGVRSGADGAFSLRSPTDRISVWHPAYSPRTVPITAAGAITLLPRGSIRGRLLDAAGHPRAGVEVRLDRKRATGTDAAGRFVFDDVEAGIRGLYVPGPRKRHLGGAKEGPWSLRVEPGKCSKPRITPGLSQVTLRLVGGTTGFDASTEVVLVGLDPLASLLAGRAAGGQLVVSHVLPGDYLLMTPLGHLARCALRGPEAVCDLGTADLTIEAKAGTRFLLVPKDANDLVRRMAGRVAQHRVPASRTWQISPLPVGTYQVLPQGGSPRTIEVRDKGATLRL